MTPETTISPPKGLKLFFMAVRAYSFPASVIPIIYGSIIAVLFNPGMKFNYFHFILALIGSVAIHVTTNIVNDIYDFKKGIDKEDKEVGIPHGGSQVLSMGLVSKSFMKTTGIISTILAVSIGVYLYTQAGIWIFYLSIFGLLSAIYYTASPFALKYKALGDIQVFVSFGTGMTLGAYIVQTHEFSWIPVILSIPFGLLIDAILHSNNIRDLNFDGKFGVKTLPILIGERLSFYFYYFLILGAYTSIIIFVVIKLLPWFALLNLVTFPTALKLLRMLKDYPQETMARHELGTKHNILTAQFNTQFGLALTIGLLISLFFL
ncbi:MAG: 1,4-dihydroxy-2-naphthoate octaprenyltransferase [Ignavibacteriae bacterium]|nr:1,4-dihydroxy-2-naphthoate octaprenyltransferase [Ignavibacteriota bacterium]